MISGKNVLAGNEKLMKLENIEFKRTDKSGTIIYTAVDGVYAGAIVIGDEIKPSARTRYRAAESYRSAQCGDAHRR